MNTNRMTLMRAPGLLLMLSVIFVSGIGASGALATDYVIVNDVIGGGGGSVTGGGKLLVGTAGQYAVGTVSGGEYSLRSGIGHDVHGILWTEVGDDVQQVSSVPSQFSLGQNFPNPFNPTTTIRFALSEPASVDLSVYNILGQSVKTLVGGDLDAGEYDVTLDASDMPTGVYFYRLTAGSLVQSRKMVILK